MAESAKSALESAFAKTKEVLNSAAESTKGLANQALENVKNVMPGQGSSAPAAGQNAVDPTIPAATHGGDYLVEKKALKFSDQPPATQ